jgi:hypothetical protein
VGGARDKVAITSLHPFIAPPAQRRSDYLPPAIASSATLEALDAMARRCDRLKREHVEAMLDHDEVARAAATGLLARASLPEAMSDLNRQYPPQGFNRRYSGR